MSGRPPKTGTLIELFTYNLLAFVILYYIMVKISVKNFTVNNKKTLCT